jgi:hypothetical protein
MSVLSNLAGLLGRLGLLADKELPIVKLWVIGLLIDQICKRIGMLMDWFSNVRNARYLLYMKAEKKERERDSLVSLQNIRFNTLAHQAAMI